MDCIFVILKMSSSLQRLPFKFAVRSLSAGTNVVVDWPPVAHWERAGYYSGILVRSWSPGAEAARDQLGEKLRTLPINCSADDIRQNLPPSLSLLFKNLAVG